MQEQYVIVPSSTLEQILNTQAQILDSVKGGAVDDEYMTRNEAAKYLKCNAQTIDNLVNEGTLAKYGRGKLQRYKKIDLQDCMKEIKHEVAHS